MTPDNKPKHPDAEYRVPDTRPGCDQEAHRARSIANQPNHLKHHEKGYKEFENSMTEGYDSEKEA